MIQLLTLLPGTEEDPIDIVTRGVVADQPLRLEDGRESFPLAVGGAGGPIWCEVVTLPGDTFGCSWRPGDSVRIEGIVEPRRVRGESADGDLAAVQVTIHCVTVTRDDLGPHVRSR